jgi:hypothetical protein
LRARSAVGTTVTRTEAANVHACSECATAHIKRLPATIRRANGCLDSVGNLASRAQELSMLRFSCKKWREALRDGIAQRKKSNKRGGNREEAVPLERGIDQVHAEGAEADPEDVLPLVADNSASAVTAGRE